MPLQLRIAGPGFELERRLAPDDPPLVLGRDADCSVCLPDPGRNISRRHLTVWNQDGVLHYHVLSTVNGVEHGGAEKPPGTRGTLVPGEALTLSAYRVAVEAVAERGAAAADPWLLLEQEAAAAVAPSGAPHDDPFGDWGFESTFGAGSPRGTLDADALQAATDLEPFLRGLGLEEGGPAAFTRGELEALGRATRIALVGLLQAAAAAGAARRDLGAGADAPGAAEAHPLRADAPVEAKLQYLYGRRSGGTRLPPPERALADVAMELLAHQEAMRAGVEAAVAGAFAEFDPEAMKGRLLGDRARLFGSARAWEAFVKEYAQRSHDLPAWVRSVLERHFGAAYLRELARLRRNGHSARR